MGNTGGKPVTGLEKQKMIEEYMTEMDQYNDQFVASNIDLSADSDEDDSEDTAPFSNIDSTSTQIFNGAASQSEPELLKEHYKRSHSVESNDTAAALTINPQDWVYPFENIVLEGGGNKGLAYVGVIKCLEKLGLMSQIKRIGGASAGAITAALVACGFTSDDLLAFAAKEDMEKILLDHSWGYFSLLPNLINKYGWNPGTKVHQWFGNQIKSKTGNPDITFYELYKLRGIELCIVVTNLNLMAAQYCHAKTTPNMPVRDALRMTMSIPGVFSPVHYDNNGMKDVYVDGGMLVNYPINCFDGWFLSMEKKDSFLNHLKSVEGFSQMMASKKRFVPIGPNKTVGFLLFDASEREVMRFGLENRFGSLHPERPRVDTELWLKKEAKHQDRRKAKKARRRIVNAVDSFLSVIHRHHLDNDPEFLTKEELIAILADEEFGSEHREVLFGKKDGDLNKVFKILDKNKDGKISCFELFQFINERGVRLQVRFQGYLRRDVDSLMSYVMTMHDTLLTNLKYTAVTEADHKRTVGINTEHISTMDYKLEQADLDFIIERGYNATISFLRYYVAGNPSLVKHRGSLEQSDRSVLIKSAERDLPDSGSSESMATLSLHNDDDDDKEEEEGYNQDTTRILSKRFFKN